MSKFAEKSLLETLSFKFPSTSKSKSGPITEKRRFAFIVSVEIILSINAVKGLTVPSAPKSPASSLTFWKIII